MNDYMDFDDGTSDTPNYLCDGVYVETSESRAYEANLEQMTSLVMHKSKRAAKRERDALRDARNCPF